MTTETRPTLCIVGAGIAGLSAGILPSAVFRCPDRPYWLLPCIFVRFSCIVFLMTTSRPYLIRAIHEWILDNAMTPYLLVDIEGEGVDVPRQHGQNGKIVLNIAPMAVQGSLGWSAGRCRCISPVS